MVTQVAASGFQHSVGLRATVLVNQRNNVQQSQAAPSDSDRVTRTQTIEREQSRLALNLRTQDGDRIQVRFGESEVSRVSVRSAGGDVSGRQLERNSERLSIKIEGELDADEREALNAVVNAAFDLAEDFFAGEQTDVAALLNAAALEGDEIARLSLKLTQKSESIQKFSGSGEDGRFESRSVERTVERLQARFESLGNGLRALLTEASESPAPQPAIQLARVSVNAALDAVLVAESDAAVGSTPGAAPAEDASVPISSSLPATPPVEEPVPVDDEQPGTVNLQQLAPQPPAVEPQPAPTEVAPVDATPQPQAPAVDQARVEETTDRPTPADDVSAPPSLAPAAPSALEELRSQLIAALELANEHGSIEVFAKRVERSETVFRVSVSA